MSIKITYENKTDEHKMEQLPNIRGSASSGNTGGSSGGVTSWNDLTDKPFGEDFSGECLVKNYRFEGTFEMGSVSVEIPDVQLHDGITYTATIDGEIFTNTASTWNDHVEFTKVIDDKMVYVKTTSNGIELTYTDGVVDGDVRDLVFSMWVGDGKVVKTIDPKYIKDLYYEAPQSVTVIDNQTLEFDTSETEGGGPAYFVQEITIPVSVIENTASVDVVFDNTVYQNVEITRYNDGDYQVIETTDYEFLIYPFGFYVAAGEDEGLFGIYTLDSAETHTISMVIHYADIHHIDPKYIKDMYGSDLTEVVSGKITNINWNENYWDGASYAVYSDGIREYLSGLSNFIPDAGSEYYESFPAAQLTVNETTRWMLSSEGCNVGVENRFDGENHYPGLRISPWNGIYLENGELYCNPIPPDIVSVFGVTSPEEVYEIGFTIYRGTFNRIDEKYIPDSIARSNDVWAAAVTVVDEAMNGITSDIEEINSALANKQDRLDTVNMKWTTSTLPANDYWTDIAYGNGRFVVTAQLSSRVAVSTDGGITWAEYSMPEKGSYISIAYGNGVFVAMEGLADKAALSTDGITWSEVLLPEQCSHGQIAYGNGMFVTIDPYSDKVSYSTDGITWNESTLPCSSAWSRIAYGNGMFVITTSIDFDDVAYSTDGITWFRSELPETGWWDSLAYGNGVFVTFNSLSNSTTAAYSTDGVVWTRTTLPESQSWASIAYGNGMFVATPKDSNKVAYSTDGITWHMSTLPESRDWTSIAYGDNTFIAVTDQQSYSNGLAARFKPLELFAAKVDKDVIREIASEVITGAMEASY